MSMHFTEPPSVFLPNNEPYLGLPMVHALDLTIPRAMEIYAAIGRRTFEMNLTPLQQAVAVVIPQGISISLSIRELIRQAYLYSGAILLRPLVERTGMAQFLLQNPSAVDAWHAGWPRRSQPEFRALVELVMPDGSAREHKLTKEILHKLVHVDPKGAAFNMFARSDGSLAFASGKELQQPAKADAICQLATHCLRRLTASAAFAFDYDPDSA